MIHSLVLELMKIKLKDLCGAKSLLKNLINTVSG